MKKLILSATLLAAMNANAGALDSVSNASRQSGQGSLTIVQGALDLSGDSANSVSTAGGQLLRASGNLVLAGWDVSKKSGRFILTTAQDSGTQSLASSKAAVTGSGQLIASTYNSTKNAVVFTVTETGELLAKGSNAVVGSVKWSGKKLAAGSEVMVNASGKVLNASGRVIGVAVDKSGKVLTFAVDKSGKIVRATSDSVVMVATASGKAAKRLAKAVGKGIKALVYGTADVSMTVLVTSDVAGHALSTGNLPASSQVLLALPSNLVEAAFGSEFHYRTIR